jgi:hypothetical protein
MSNHEPVEYGAVCLVAVLLTLVAFGVAGLALHVIGRVGL